MQKPYISLPHCNSVKLDCFQSILLNEAVWVAGIMLYALLFCKYPFNIESTDFSTVSFGIL